MGVMTVVVFLINGFTKHDWKEAFFFALAIAVGLTPEMLPMIVTGTLAIGAVTMSKKKVIAKRLNSIQNFGARAPIGSKARSFRSVTSWGSTSPPRV